MQEAGPALLARWQNFYVIVGTAAATLTGLMFVATTLMSRVRTQASSLRAGVEAFATPVLVQFGIPLLVAAILSAPWPALWQAGLLLGLVGLGGAARHRDRRAVGTPPDPLCGDAGRPGVVQGSPARRLRGAGHFGACAARQPRPGALPDRWGDRVAPVRRNPQRLGQRHLPRNRALRAGETEPGLTNSGTVLA